MRVGTLNLNGLRSAVKKGFLEWLNASQIDVLCVQEIRAHAADIMKAAAAPAGYHGIFHPALRKGYSGVGIYSRRPPIRIIEGLGIAEIDEEGRYLQLDFEDLSIASVYLPSGSSSSERQTVKFSFMERVRPLLEKFFNSGKPFLLCGDWNIAHTPLDLKNWRGNLKNSGFLPEERDWLSQLFCTIGWVDVFRQLYPQEPGYTWWSQRGQAYAHDVGWRIDYQLATPDVAKRARAAHVFKAQKFSDHAPLIVDYAEA